MAEASEINNNELNQKKISKIIRKPNKQISLTDLEELNAVKRVKDSFNRHLHLNLLKDRRTATKRDFFQSIAGAVFENLAHRWIRTQQHYDKIDPKVFFFYIYLLYQFLLCFYVHKRIVK